MNYGLPYAGSKNQFANKILEVLPPADTFVDLFAGGCSMTHAAMLSGKYKHFIANDINHQIVQLFKDAIDGKYKDEERWISREDWLRLKDTDAYVKYCWSFSNGGVSYQYGEDIEPYKKALHYAVCWGDFGQLRGLCPEVVNACEERLRSIADRKQRRIEIGRAIVERLKEIGDYDLVMNNPLYKSCHWKGRVKGKLEAARLQSLQSLESLQRLQSLESLQSLQRLQRLQRLQSLELLTVTRGDYREVVIPDGAVVYCDPPYKGTVGYLVDFDHEAFYEWLRTRSFPVYVSEYAMPDDFVKVWSKRTRSLLSATSNNTAVTEGLWLHKRWTHTSKPVQSSLFEHEL